MRKGQLPFDLEQEEGDLVSAAEEEDAMEATAAAEEADRAWGEVIARSMEHRSPQPAGNDYLDAPDDATDADSEGQVDLDEAIIDLDTDTVGDEAVGL